jgi:SAM-dependent methyltransferase
MSGPGEGGPPIAYRIGCDPVEAFTEFMRSFHALHDGSFTEARTTAGPTSYRLLADRVGAAPEGGELTVLDLGCGSGRLLEILADEGGPGLRLVGVDFVPEQIARARVRLGEAPVALHCAEARDLPLASASVDRVLVHMGLALMQPLEATLSEIDRVLRPGGRLAAVLDGTPAPDALDRVYADMLWRRVTGERPELLGSHLVDARASETDRLSALVRGAIGMTGPVEAFAFELLLEVTASEFVEFAEGDHLWKLLTEKGAAELREEVRTLFPEGDARRVEVPIAMRLVVFEKPGAA